MAGGKQGSPLPHTYLWEYDWHGKLVPVKVYDWSGDGGRDRRKGEK